MDFAGEEKRRYPRVNSRCVISYHARGIDQKVDESQLKNISLAGVLFTTSEPYSKGTNLALKIRLASTPSPVMTQGNVVESYEVVRNLIYDTRLEFESLSEYDRQLISETLDSCLKNKK